MRYALKLLGPGPYSQSKPLGLSSTRPVPDRSSEKFMRSSPVRTGPDLRRPLRSSPPPLSTLIYTIHSGAATGGTDQASTPSFGSVSGISRGLPPSASHRGWSSEGPAHLPARLTSRAARPRLIRLRSCARHVSYSQFLPEHASAAITDSRARHQPGTAAGLGSRDLHLRSSPGADRGTRRAHQHIARTPKAQPQGPLPTSGECRLSRGGEVERGTRPGFGGTELTCPFRCLPSGPTPAACRGSQPCQKASLYPARYSLLPDPDG